MPTCCAFLGLPDPPETPRFTAYNARPSKGMEQETRSRLVAHFAEPNRRLEEYLGITMGWASEEHEQVER